MFKNVARFLILMPQTEQLSGCWLAKQRVTEVSGPVCTGILGTAGGGPGGGGNGANPGGPGAG